MTEPAKTGLGYKALKTAGIVLISLAGFFLTGLVLVYLLAEPILERYFKKQVAVQTAGLYQVSFDDLQLHLRTRSITLQGLHLYPDTTVHHRQKEKGQAGRTLFDMQSPKLKVTRIDLVDLLFRNRLRINTVVAERPVMTQLLDESVDKEPNRGSKGSSSLKTVSIRQFHLQEAKYRYLVLGQRQRPRHELSRLSLQVRDLRLNLQEHRGFLEMLRAGRVELNIRDYAFHAPDSLYAISIRRLFYSSRKQMLRAEGVALQPDYQANATIPEYRAQHLLYQLRIRLLYLVGLDAGTAWRTKRLQLDKLLVARPSLHVMEDLSVSDSLYFPELADIYAQISPYLIEITAREVRLSDGSFSYRQKSSAVHTIHHLDKATINLQALQLDSATLFAPKAKAFAAGIRAAISNYAYTPHNSPYRFGVGSLQLSTQDKTLQVDGLHLTGDWDKNDTLKSHGKALHTFYSISLPRLRFHGMDLLQALQTSRLAIGSITAEEPVIDVRTDQQVASIGERGNLQEAGRQLSGLVNRLEIGKIDIVEASLTMHSKTRRIQRLQELERANLTATGLHVDLPYTFHPDEKLPLEDIVVTAQSYRSQLPDNTYTFVLTGLRYSTRQLNFTAHTVDVISSSSTNDRQERFGNASRNLFDLSANGLQVTDVDLLRALHTRRLEVDLVVLRQPNVTLLVDRKVTASESGRRGVKKGIFQLVDIISANDIHLQDGSFAFNERLDPVMRTHWLEHVNASVSGFVLTPAIFANLNDALPMREMSLQAKNYTYLTTDSLYTIRLDSLYYSSRTKEVIAHKFSVRADREVNERLKAEKPDLASRNLIDISADRSRITGFNLIHAYATGQYHMKKLLLTDPSITILQDHNVNPIPVKATTGHDMSAIGDTIIKQQTDIATAFRVERLEVTDGTFDFNILEDTIRISQTLEHVALGIDQLRLISLEATDPLEIFDAEDVDIVVKGYTFFSRDSLYALEVKEMRASMQNRSLSVDSLRLRPLYSKEEYAILFRYARDRIDLAVPAIEVRGISLQSLFNDQDIIAHKMIILNPEAEIYRDNRIGIDPELRPPTLQSALRGASFYIRLDTVLVEKNILRHPVIAIEGIKPAVFLLDDIRMRAFNVTNDTALIRLNNILTVDGTALFMGVSTLQAHFRFQLDHPEDRYTYEGMLEAMDFTALNPLLENMIFIKIKSGRIQHASFKIEATSEESLGSVHFPYNNLKVQLLNKHDPDNPGLLLQAGSRLVNMLIVKSNNPSARGRFREGVVNKGRDPKRSVPYHMSQSMLEGITHSLMTKLVYRIVSRFTDL